ncbi:hypothetical protein ACA910_003999 [Epithemia clementina (nom. ined.)]
MTDRQVREIIKELRSLSIQRQAIIEREENLLGELESLIGITEPEPTPSDNAAGRGAARLNTPSDNAAGQGAARFTQEARASVEAPANTERTGFKGEPTAHRHTGRPRAFNNPSGHSKRSHGSFEFESQESLTARCEIFM